MALFGLAFGLWEMVIVGVVGVLFFGKRLPEVARQMGNAVVEFKKGLKGMEDDFHGAINSAGTPNPAPAAPEPPRPPQRLNTTAPKFEEPVDSEGKPRS